MALAVEPRPPLKGGVEHSEHERQREAYCERYANSIDPFEGRLQVMPKAGQGNRDFCLAPRPNWTLLGEDRNYCCFFAPRDWAIKIPPLPGNVQKEQTPPKRRPPPNDPQAYPTPRPKPPFPPADQPQPPLEAKVKKDSICNLQQLAVWVFDNYSSNVGPISTVRVRNASTPTYLVLLSGMQAFKGGQATTAADAYIAWLNVQALDAYHAALLDAVQTLPRASNLILVGHSQGGMVAQNAVSALRAQDFNVIQVITYGAPITAPRQDGTQYLHVRAQHDPIPALDRYYELSPIFVLSERGTDMWNPLTSPNGSHNYYPQSLRLAGRALPPLPLLRAPCLEVYLETLRQYRAPDGFSRIFATPTGSYPATVSTSPRNPDQCRNNCFWVSLAQDMVYAVGLDNDLRFWGRCEPAPIADSDIPVVLQRWFGGKPLDDLHGYDPATRLTGAERHRRGEKVLSSKQHIEQVLGAAEGGLDGRGARGLVFWKSRPGERVGHVFNARNDNGRIRFWDAQGPCDYSGMFGPGTEISFYRTN
jgi:pimeloyl-ACP methyl ester carboxylesterase